MKKNELSVFQPAYCRWYRIDKKIKQFFRNIKWAWQRVTKGYADYDTWDLDYWLVRLLPQAIRTLESGLHGHPYDMTEEEWHAYLLEMAAHFENYSTEWENPIELPSFSIEELFIKDGQKLHRLSIDEIKNPDYQEKRKLWLEEEKKHAEYIKEELHKGLSMMEARFGDLWD